jgi:hypothetical protein
MLPILAFTVGIYLGPHFSILAMVAARCRGMCTLLCSNWALGLNSADLFELALLAAFAVRGSYMIGPTARERNATLTGRPDLPNEPDSASTAIP